MSRRNEIEKLLATFNHRLQKLREKQALRGIDTPSEILIEIEDIEAEIDRLQKELEALDPCKQTVEPTDAIECLKIKLDALNDLSICRFCLVGGVYLDISLYPITTTELGEDEWGNIDELEYDLGGSTVWVGRFLWEKGQKSYLFSALGASDDPHTVQFNNLFENESWPLNKVPMGESEDKTPVTVHLIQGHKRFGTMFTLRGVLDGFTWDDFIPQLKKTLTHGGVLYISGYLKTNLHKKLTRMLELLPQNILICIDHGRLARNRFSSRAAQALRVAFDTGLIDLYFCTHNEIFNLFDISRPPDFPSDWRQVEQMLQQVAAEKPLPVITMVRGGRIREKTRAFAIIGKSVYPLEGTIGLTYIRKTVGPNNAFNASMMYHLVHCPKFPKLEDRVVYAGNMAFKEWEQWTKKPK